MTVKLETQEYHIAKLEDEHRKLRAVASRLLGILDFYGDELGAAVRIGADELRKTLGLEENEGV